MNSKKGGRFKIGIGGYDGSRQHYLGNSNVLRTILESDSGELSVSDFMLLWVHMAKGLPMPTI